MIYPPEANPPSEENFKANMKDFFKKKFLVRLSISLSAVLLLIIANIFIDSDINRRVVKIQNLRKDLAFRAQAVNALLVLKEESRRAQNYLGVLQNILPSPEQLINFRKAVRTMGISNQVDADLTFGAQESGIDGEPGHIGFNMSANTNSLDAFANFLTGIETGNYLVAINSIQLNQSVKGVKATLAGQVYSR